MKTIQNRTYSKERELYNSYNLELKNCLFQGIEDGESPLKESNNIIVRESHFSLRYPLWHSNILSIHSSKFDNASRAPIWYSKNVNIFDSHLHCVKAVRECENVFILNSDIISEEFAWKSKNITIEKCNVEGFYSFLDTKEIRFLNSTFKGKYSFQYVDNLYIENSTLTAKDAFWHAKNVIIKNCVINGEYLAWYSDNVTFIDCKIIGTQPFCYCTRLKLINCQMENADNAFEYSDVSATIIGKIDSIKNPRSGIIQANEIGKVILSDSIMHTSCRIIENKIQ